VIGLAISLEEVKMKINVSILESLDKGVRKLANLGKITSKISILLLTRK